MGVLVKEFKESRQSQKTTVADKIVQGISTVTISPNSSRPVSPNPGSDSSASNLIGKQSKENIDSDKPKADKRKNEDIDSSNKKSVNSPE